MNQSNKCKSVLLGSTQSIRSKPFSCVVFMLDLDATSLWAQQALVKDPVGGKQLFPAIVVSGA